MGDLIQMAEASERLHAPGPRVTDWPRESYVCKECGQRKRSHGGPVCVACRTARMGDAAVRPRRSTDAIPGSYIDLMADELERRHLERYGCLYPPVE